MSYLLVNKTTLQKCVRVWTLDLLYFTSCTTQTQCRMVNSSLKFVFQSDLDRNRTSKKKRIWFSMTSQSSLPPHKTMLYYFTLICIYANFMGAAHFRGALLCCSSVEARLENTWSKLRVRALFRGLCNAAKWQLWTLSLKMKTSDTHQGRTQATRTVRLSSKP